MPQSIIIGGPLVKAGAPTSGVYQAETAVIVGTITLAGNASIVLTAAGMTGSPITLPVATADEDTAAEVATKIRAALQANAVIAAYFTISGAGANVLLTRKESRANDATLNLAYDNDTCEGLTPDATSDNTTAGVAGDYRGSEPGTFLLDTTNLAIYRNDGDTSKPTWTAI
jgi:phage tail sheath gpL-like